MALRERRHGVGRPGNCAPVAATHVGTPSAPIRTIEPDESFDLERSEPLPLAKAAEYLLEECRMVLPGIQALFGFQLIAVFSAGFAEKLTRLEQVIHLAAIALTTIAVALIMTPAALHRHTGARVVTDLFVRLSSRLLLFSMVPLALSVSMEFYLIARVIVGETFVALFAIALFVIFLMLWFALPRARGLHRRIAGARSVPR